MCIIADSVEDVSKTKIISFHVAYSLDDGKNIIPSQLIVYSAQVNSLVDTNAFILPIYNPGNDPQKIIPLDLSKMSDFFDEVENIFSRWFPKKLIRSSSYSMTNSFRDDSLLEVHQVGDYQFSIMPSKLDFSRIDRSKLNVNPAAKTAIDVHSGNYSFIVYQFYQKGKVDITPFGYLCPFASGYTMIIPTIHGHPHETMPNIGTGYVPNTYVSYKSDFENQATFDHEIYGLIKSPSDNNIMNKQDVVDIDKLLRKINKDYLNRKIRIYVPRNFYPKKLELKGYKMNRNILIKMDGHQYLKDLIVDQNY